MAKYMLLIYGNAQHWDNIAPKDMSEIDAGHRAFVARAGSSILAAGQLEPMSMATTLRGGADGRTSVTDGPFLESKEVVGGFYVLDASDLDEVISLANELAEVKHDHSGVEIVPLVDHG